MRSQAAAWGPRRGQTVIEYTAAAIVVAAALAGMAIYCKRALSGRIRAGMDSVGEQYHPRQTSSGITLTVGGTTVTTSKLLLDQDVNGTKVNVMQTTSTEDGDTNKTGTENISKMGNSIWQ